MKLKITKTTEQDIEVDLTTPKYITLHSCMYWKFVEIEGKIQVTRISLNTSGANSISIDVRSPFDSDLALLSEVGVKPGITEVTADEFNQVLNEWLVRFNFLPQ